MSSCFVLAESNCLFQVSQTSLPVDFLSNNNTRFSDTTTQIFESQEIEIHAQMFSSNDRTRESGGRNARGGGSTADGGFDNIC